ncbi:MAG: AMP-binding protein [Oscillospiraceae bacterium]|nr:AMP-binding protein [Oscillospiraceae bacterium]
MLLDRFLEKASFDSYEDFKQNYTLKIPENFNFGFDVVDEWAKLSHGKTALVWCDDHGIERRFTFGDIKTLSNRTANFLTGLGIKKGDCVMLFLGRRWQYWICAVALHKIGAVLIPASAQLTAKDIMYRNESADVKAIIAMYDEYVIEQIEKALGSTPASLHKIITEKNKSGWLRFEDEIEQHPDVFERPSGEAATRNDEIFLTYFTSGTTGMPKMIAHNHTHPLGHIVTAKYWQKVIDNELHFTAAESGWAKFGWGNIYGQWICGAGVFAYDMAKFAPCDLLDMIQKYKPATFCAPPTMFRFMIQEDLSGYDLSFIKHCTTAGEPLNPEVYNRWRELTGLKLCEGFGQSESSVMVANFDGFTPRPGSMGKPAPLYDIDIIDENGNSCDTGVEGEMVVRNIDKYMPVGLFVEIFKDKQATAKILGTDIYRTGDIVWKDSKGYFWYVGRSDDVIKCSGYRIGPFEVESALMEHPAVVECAITAAPDPIRGQVVKATVVLSKNYTPDKALVKELQDHVKKATAPYKYPRIVEFVSALPKTISGKTRRVEIREREQAKTETPV